MKRFLIPLIISAAALVAFAACEPKPEVPDEPEVPASIDATFNTLFKGDIVKGDVNTFPVSAKSSSEDLTLSFYADKIYLPAGTYAVGEGNGNFKGHYKNDVVDNDIKSGSITVDISGDGDYTLSGTLRLDNEVGTILKLNAAGTLAYEIPTEYYYTIAKGQSVGSYTANVYKIYDLGCHQIAEVAVVGEEVGEFSLIAKNLVPAVADGGTWVYVDGYGTESYLHGKVTISSSFGKKTFHFEDIHDVILANCELKPDLTPVYEDAGPFTWGFYTYSVVKSPIVNGAYEATLKLFYRLEGDAWGPEFLSTTIITDDDDFLMHNLAAGLPSAIVSYEDYASFTPEFATSTYYYPRLAPQGASFYFVNGKKVTCGLSAETGKFMVVNCQAVAEGIYAIVLAPIDMAYAGPDDLMTVLAGNIYNAMGCQI